MIPNLLIPEFDPATHTYKVKGNSVDGVTIILRSTFGANPFWTQAGREAGQAAHVAIHYYAQNDLDYDSLHESVKPRLDAYIKFCADMNFKPDMIEQPLYRESPLYCGTPDQVQTGRVIVDFKNGPVLPEVSLQLAGYAHMLPNPLLYERWGVNLDDNGTYSLKIFPKQEMTSDWVVFQSCLNTHNWRKRYERSRTK